MRCVQRRACPRPLNLNLLPPPTPLINYGISDALPLAIPSAEAIETERTQEGFIRLIYRDGETKYSSRVISDGTLRVLGLFAILSQYNKASTIGFEEPENGVHPRRLSIIARLLENTVLRDSHVQVLVTTHSPRLPEFLRPEYSALSDRVLLTACSKRNNETEFEYIHKSPLFVQVDVESALNEVDPVTLEEVLMRGDFGG